MQTTVMVIVFTLINLEWREKASSGKSKKKCEEVS